MDFHLGNVSTIHNGFIYLVGLLVFVHLLFDYSFQPDFMARAKNHKHPIPGVSWLLVLVSHCFMHAFAVYLVTQNLIAFIVEFTTHLVIDYLKCDERISFEVDQFLHILVKICIAIYVLHGF